MYLEQRVEEIAGRLLGIEAALASKDEQADAVDRRLNAVESLTGAEGDHRDAIEVRLAGVESWIDEQRSRGVEERLAGLEATDAAFRDGAQEVEKVLVQLERNDSDFLEVNRRLEERIDALAPRLEQIDEDSKRRWEERQGDDQRFDSLQRGIDDLAGRTEERLAEIDIGGVENRVGQLESELSGLRDQGSNLGVRIEALDRSLSDVTTASGELVIRADLLEERLGQLDPAAFDEKLALLEQQTQRCSALIPQMESFSASVRQQIERLAAQDAELRESLEGIRNSLEGIRNDQRDNDVRERLGALEERFEASDRLAAFDALATRVDRLEHESRGLGERLGRERERPTGLSWTSPPMIAIAAGFLLLFLFTWLATRPASTIIVRRFVLHDAQGSELAELMTDTDGAALILRDREGIERLAVRLDPTGPRIRMADAAGTSRLDMSVAGAESAMLAVRDASGVERLRCAVDDRPLVALFDGAGGRRASVAVTAAGAEFELLESNERPRVRIASESGMSHLRLFDEMDRLRAALGTTPDGVALNLFDESKQRRVALGSNQSGPALGFLGKNGAQRTTLGLTKGGDSVLNLHDPAGSQRIVLNVSAADAAIRILDADAKPRFSVP